MLRKFWAGEKAGVRFKYSMSHQFYIIKTDEVPHLFFFSSLFFLSLSFKNLVNSLLLVAFTGFVGREVSQTGLWLLRSLFKQWKSFRVQYLTFPGAEMDWNDKLRDRHDSFVIWSNSSFTFLVLSWPVIIQSSADSRFLSWHSYSAGLINGFIPVIKTPQPKPKNKSKM